MPPLHLLPADLLALITATAARATILLGIAAVATFVARRHAASLRHLIWSAALLASVVAIPFSLVLPSWRVLPEASPPIARDVSPAASATPISSAEFTSPPILNSNTDASAQAISGSTQFNWPAWLVALWAIGALVVASRYLRSRHALRRFSRVTASPADLALARELAAAMGVHRPVTVRCTDAIDVPLTYGVIAPVILLPMEAHHWPAHRRTHVICHEIAHIGRFDAATQLIATLAESLLWFHPGVWYAARAAHREREAACDDAVLRLGACPSDYAADLLAFAPARHAGALTALAIVPRGTNQLVRRVVAVLDPATRRGEVTARRVAAVAATTLACVVPLAAMRPRLPTLPSIEAPIARAILAVIPRDSTPAPHRRHTESPAPSVPAPAAHADLGPLAGCAEPMTIDEHRHDARDGAVATWTAHGEGAACRFDLTALGEVRFDADGVSNPSLAPGAVLSITIQDGSAVQSLQAEAGSDGATVYRFNGAAMTADFALPWLTTTMTLLDGYFAFAVDSRFPLLMAQGSRDRTQHHRRDADEPRPDDLPDSPGSTCRSAADRS